MLEDELFKISNEIYYVKDGCTYKKGVGKLCNFYISDISIFTEVDKEISFEITLEKIKKSNGKTHTRTNMFPISYLNDPICWFFYGFDSNKFRIEVSRKEFEISMIEIINLIRNNEKHETYDNYIGWKLKRPKEEEIFEKEEIYFGKFDDPGVSLGHKGAKKHVQNYVFEYMKLSDISVTAPLMSYMLLSLLTGLEFFGTNARPDFNVALVGGNEILRRKFALFFTNLYKRDPLFFKNEYKFFHINEKDVAADMRFKAAAANDCVLIAFEPDKRHLNILLKEIYKTNVIDKKKPIKNLLLFTCDDYEATDENTLVIKLNESHNTKALEEYFGYIYHEFDVLTTTIRDDLLMQSIYHYIKRILRELLVNKNYVRDKFIKHNEKFRQSIADVPASEKAIEVAQNLSFAFELYSKAFSEKNEYFCREVYDAILKAAVNSFPVKGQITNDEFKRTVSVCKQADTYFKKISNWKRIGKIGCENNPDEKRVWWDDETIYIKQNDLNEFSKLTDSDLRYNNKSGKALASRNLIRTYVKSDNKSEYSVHIQKALRPVSEAEKDKEKTDDKNKRVSKCRFIGFIREVCREYNLFDNIELAIEDRIKKDKEAEDKQKAKEMRKSTNE